MQRRAILFAITLAALVASAAAQSCALSSGSCLPTARPGTRRACCSSFKCTRVTDPVTNRARNICQCPSGYGVQNFNACSSCNGNLVQLVNGMCTCVANAQRVDGEKCKCKDGYIQNGIACEKMVYLSYPYGNHIDICSTGNFQNCAARVGGFNKPWAVASTYSNVYVGNHGNNTIFTCKRDLTYCYKHQQFDNPNGIGIIGSRVYVSNYGDYGDGSVSVCTSSLGYCSKATGFIKPWGIAAGRAIYVPSYSLNAVYLCSAPLKSASQSCALRFGFSGPVAVHVGLNGSVYISNQNSNSVSVCNFDLSACNQVYGFYEPGGIKTVDLKTVHVVNGGNNSVTRCNADLTGCVTFYTATNKPFGIASV